MSDPDAKMPLTEHLEELRWRILRALGAVAVGFGISYAFADRLFAFLAQPLLVEHSGTVELIGTGVPEAFFTKLKVSVIAGTFFASPVIFHQAWRFVAPGLYEHEKRYARPFVLFATAFFVLGAAFCYWVVFPIGFAFFLQQYASVGIRPTIRISEYLSFSARLLLGFGLTFELPVVTFFLARAGIVTYRTLLRTFRYAVLVMFIVAAVLTPPDVASQLLMVAPLLCLYGISIAVAYAFGRRPER